MYLYGHYTLFYLISTLFEEIMMTYFVSTGDEEIGDLIMQLKNNF